jgi:hypothetical protein
MTTGKEPKVKWWSKKIIREEDVLHTQGEWRIEKSDGKFPMYNIVVGEIGEAASICILHTAMNSLKDQQQANAELICRAVNERQRLIDENKRLVAAYSEQIKVREQAEQENKRLIERAEKAEAAAKELHDQLNELQHYTANKIKSYNIRNSLYFSVINLLANGLYAKIKNK